MSFLYDIALTIDELPVGDASRSLIRSLARGGIPAAVIVLGADGPEVDTVVGALYRLRFCESGVEICGTCELCTNVRVDGEDPDIHAPATALGWASSGRKCLRVSATMMRRTGWARLQAAVAARETPPLVVYCTTSLPSNSAGWPIIRVTPASHAQLTRTVRALALAMDLTPPPLRRSQIDFADVVGTMFQEQRAASHFVVASDEYPKPRAAVQSEPVPMTLFDNPSPREEVRPRKPSRPRVSAIDKFRTDLRACTGIEFGLDGAVDTVLYDPGLRVDWADAASRIPTEAALVAPKRTITALRKRGLLGPPPYLFLDVMRVDLLEYLKRMGTRGPRHRDGAMKIHLTKPYGHISVSKRGSCLVVTLGDPRKMGMDNLVRLPSIKMAMLTQRQEREK